MQNRAVILNELREISPLLADLGPLNPYKVPTGYFEGLAGELLQKVKVNEVEVSPILKSASSNPFTVPQGYFENLAETILKRIKAGNTESAGEELAILSPLLNKLGKKTPFSTPGGYFEELTDNAVAGAKAIDFVNEELENLSPVLNSLQNKQVYNVPAGYFENLPVTVLEKAKAQIPAARVVKMNFTRKVVRYAVAAVIAGGLIVSGWFYFGNSHTIVEGGPYAGIQDSLSKISDEGLANYLEDQNDATADAPVINNVDNDIKPNDMKDMLADVSDAELQQYLEQYGNGNPTQATTN